MIYKKLKELCILKNGYAFKSKDFSQNGVPVIKIKNVKPNKILLEGLSYVPQEIADSKLEYKISKGDILITMTGNRADGSPDSWVGKVALFREEGTYLLNQRLAIIRPISDDVDLEYLAYYLSSWETQLYFIKRANSSGGQANISPSIVGEYDIALPNKNEQMKIASLLRDFDLKIRLNANINNNLEQQASVLVRQYCESLTSSVELGTVLSFENGFAFQSSSYHEKGKYRIITIKNVQDGRIDAQGAACIDDIPPRMKQGCFLTIGDVLLSLTGNVGRVGIVCENDLLLNQRVAKFIPKDIRTLPLLYFYFRLPTTKISLETISKGTAQQNLSPIETLKLEIPYETKQALELSNLLQPIFDTIYQKNIENIQLSEIRDSLLPKLMSGELDVSDIEI